MNETEFERATIAILAGGESRRMGRDKAKLVYRGEPLLERVAGAAKEVAPTAVVGREDDEAFDLSDVPFVADREPGLGPIGGLETALGRFGGPVLALACDMPRVDAAAIRWLLESFESEGADRGLVGTTDGQLQPLFAVYTSTVDETLEAMIERGERSLHRLVERCGLATCELPDRVDERIVNVNTPEEFRALGD